MDGRPDLFAAGGGLTAALASFVGDAVTDEAAGARSREAFLRRTAAEEGSFAGVLVDLAESHGRTTPEGVLIDLPLSQEEVAGLISASRESVARGLAGLRDRGLITTARRAITVLDLAGLRSYAKAY